MDKINESEFETLFYWKINVTKSLFMQKQMSWNSICRLLHGFLCLDMNFCCPSNILNFLLMLCPFEVLLSNIDVNVWIGMVWAFNMDFDLHLFLQWFFVGSTITTNFHPMTTQCQYSPQPQSHFLYWHWLELCSLLWVTKNSSFANLSLRKKAHPCYSTYCSWHWHRLVEGLTCRCHTDNQAIPIDFQYILYQDCFWVQFRFGVQSCFQIQLCFQQRQCFVLKYVERTLSMQLAENVWGTLCISESLDLPLEFYWCISSRSGCCIPGWTRGANSTISFRELVVPYR